MILLISRFIIFKLIIMKYNYLIALLLTILLVSCQPDTSFQVLPGVKLGISYQEYIKELDEVGINKTPSGIYYYTFETDKGKKFYGAIYPTIFNNKVGLVRIHITQRFSYISTVGKDMEDGQVWVQASLVDLTDDEIPSEEEIYTSLKSTFDRTYIKGLADRQTLDNISMYEDFAFYDAKNGVRVELDRFVKMSPPMNDALTPRGCITIIYALPFKSYQNN
ncbi:MAG: hypothetical protein JWP69_1581 [Flaviaesturariibacter sp.]|nr:hypothetical protein [Flaviaesturariibacter sp.]